MLAIKLSLQLICISDLVICSKYQLYNWGFRGAMHGAEAPPLPPPPPPPLEKHIINPLSFE